jgi:hypothetical protein
MTKKSNIMPKSETRGGRREGAGRPKLDDPRKIRGIKFNGSEWSLIKHNAEAREMSAREYISFLAEKDEQ